MNKKQTDVVPDELAQRLQSLHDRIERAAAAPIEIVDEEEERLRRNLEEVLMRYPSRWSVERFRAALALTSHQSAKLRASWTKVDEELKKLALQQQEGK